MVTVDGLTVSVDGHVLRSGISFQLKRGEILRIAGPNGAGKSTLIRMLIEAGLNARREVTYGFQFDLGRTVSHVPQNANETLLPWLSCRENVMIGLSRASKVSVDASFVELASNFLGAKVKGRDVIEALENYKKGVDIFSLSGGERQKLAILRGAICCPRLFVLDEPFAELDKMAVCALEAYLRKFAATGSVILVTHQDVDLAYGTEVNL
ncbi:MAG: ABC transporter ATP-binding protein [Acidobacteriota bacterium]